MNPADWVHGLFAATLTSSAAILLVLALRPPLRAAFGLRVAYGAWAMVPASLVAVLLPFPPQPLGIEMPSIPVLVTGSLQPLPSFATTPGIHLPDSAWLAAWLAGGLLMAGLLAWRQRRFLVALGSLQVREDGLRVAQGGRGLPATIGFWRPGVVLPADFDARFDAAQQAMILAHEGVHIARGDMHANALMAALRCVFWFNPWFHYAARLFRQDQELACDAIVVASHPRGLRAYGEAMLLAGAAAHPMPLGCHFGFGHPLKERIAMLKHPSPSRSRRLVGSMAIVMVTLASGYAAWAAQPDASQGSRPPAASNGAQVAQSAKGALPRRRTAPVYPGEARAQGVSGKVMLVVEVAADGSVREATVESSRPAGVFDAAALESVRQWTFAPAMKDGVPVASRIRVPIRFELDGDAATPGTAGVPGTRSVPNAWSSYERMVNSLSASWEPPAPQQDDC